MNQAKRYFYLLALPVLFGMFVTSTALGQADDDKSAPNATFEITLHVVVGSDEKVPGANLPANLNGVARQLKSNYNFANYRLTDTFLGRVANFGTIEYKSVSNILGASAPADGQSFLEWNLGQVRSIPTGFYARSFRFGARVPVQMMVIKEDGGKLSGPINYESIGLNVNTLGFPANTPTLVGTVNMPKTGGTVFVIATIRQAEM